jgi:Fe-S-cluster-containing hydrogenase component 2
MVNEEKCDGCGWCIEACDFGAIAIHPEKKVAIVCDLCGGEPECIKWCPEEALQLITTDVLAQKARINVVERLLLNVRR